MSSETHGALDYALACGLALAPILFPAGTPRTAAVVCYGLAVGVWLLSALTRYPWNFFGVLPLRVHGIVELLLAAFLLVYPWVVGLADRPLVAVVFTLAGIAALAMSLATDYRGAGEWNPPHEPPIDRGAVPPHQGP